MRPNNYYEQPVTEAMRICLRLEHLFRQLNKYRNEPTPADSHLAMTALLKSLEVIDRPDLKGKLTQTLTQQAIALSQLQHSPHVDHIKLSQLLTHVDQLVNHLHHSPGKIGESLRRNPFLNQIRLHLLNPAGPSPFTTPAYFLWLEQPSEIRLEDLKFWANDLDQLNSAVTTILRITRDSTNTQEATAHSGLYQQSLDPNLPCQLVRISISNENCIYPEISVGKHRLVIRLLQLNAKDTTPNPNLQHDVDFQLGICRV